MAYFFNGLIMTLSVCMILLTILQPSRANAASLLSGGESDTKRLKARGVEAALIRWTWAVGLLFMIVSFVVAIR